MGVFAFSRDGSIVVREKPQSVPARQGGVADLQDWHSVVAGLDMGGIARQLADNCVYGSWDSGNLELTLDPAHKHLQVESSEQRLKRALEDYLGCSIKLCIKVEQPGAETPAQRHAKAQVARQRQAEQTMAGDPLVRAVEEQFGAQLVTGSVKPIDKT